jgi:hypothetical protein
MQSTASDEKAGTIHFKLLPCERCGKEVSSDLPHDFTFTINPDVKLIEETDER